MRSPDDLSDMDSLALDRTDLDRADLDRADLDRADLGRDDTNPVGRHESGDAEPAPAPADVRTEPRIDDAPEAVGVAPVIPAQNAAPADDRLLDSAVTGRFQERWHEVQAGFVDDPTAAVTAAATLLDEVSTELTNAIRRQHESLTIGDARGQGDETERLRTNLQAYRRLVMRLIEA